MKGFWEIVLLTLIWASVLIFAAYVVKVLGW